MDDLEFRYPPPARGPRCEPAARTLLTPEVTQPGKQNRKAVL
jgi:hypothetical protein